LYFTWAGLVVLELVTCILCFLYFLIVFVWLSVPLQLIACKDSSVKWPIMCRVGC